MPFIELKNITKSFGETKALNGISFKVSKGAIFGLLGPNGAGKTTTINIICCLLKQDSGEITINGIAGDGQDRIGVIPQDISMYDELTVADNLGFFGSVYGSRDLDLRMSRFIELVQLEDKFKSKVGTLSGGQKRRLNLAVGLINDPEIILMDEPTVGIDPQSRNFIFETIVRLKEAGKTIIYTTHYLEEAEKLCDYIAIIDEGIIIKEGTVSELAQFEQEIQLTTDCPQVISTIAASMGAYVNANGQSVKIRTSDAVKVITQLVQKSEGEGYKITGILVRKVSLEEMFLKLTGKRLRE
ncbi:MAG: ABC transporter ATP-binding protein [Planctomycetes bacterium]|nr:ABC transporter ATP-binding protein [Planctomycetota bacterium]